MFDDNDDSSGVQPLDHHGQFACCQKTQFFVSRPKRLIQFENWPEVSLLHIEESRLDNLKQETKQKQFNDLRFSLNETYEEM